MPRPRPRREAPTAPPIDQPPTWTPTIARGRAVASACLNMIEGLRVGTDSGLSEEVRRAFADAVSALSRAQMLLGGA